MEAQHSFSIRSYDSDGFGVSSSKKHENEDEGKLKIHVDYKIAL